MSDHSAAREDRRAPTDHGGNALKISRLGRIGLLFCFAASILITLEGIIFVLRSTGWQSYSDLVIGIAVLVASLGVTMLHSRRNARIACEISVGVLSIASFIFFGGGFYLGFILGLSGALLVAVRD